MDPEQPAPEDPAEAWTDAEYQAWVERICAEAAEADDAGVVAESGGPDLPRTWWAPLLSDWHGGPADLGREPADGEGGEPTGGHRGEPTGGEGGEPTGGAPRRADRLGWRAG